MTATPVREMSTDQLRQAITEIERLNPHTFKSLRSWQLRNAQLGRNLAEWERMKAARS